jgi:lysyl-tRNA synthetase class 2
MSNEAEQIAQRQAKLDELARLGVAAYPNAFDRTATVSAIKPITTPAPVRNWRRPAIRCAWPAVCSACGRSGRRTSWCCLTGASGLQAYVRADSVPAADFEIYKRLDLGDQIGVEGKLFRTKTNELTVWVSRCIFWPSACCRCRRSGMGSRHRDALPPAVPRSDRESGFPQGLRDARKGRSPASAGS